MKSSRSVGWVFLFVLTLFLNHCATSPSVVQLPAAGTPPSVERISVIEKISLVEGGNYSRILVEGSEPIALPFYKMLTEPLRIAIDIPNVDLKQIRSPIKVDNGTIGDVSAMPSDGKGRIEIGLVNMTNYTITREDRILTIDIEKPTKSGEEKPVAKEEPPPREAPATVAAISPAQPLEEKSVAKEETPVKVTEIAPDVTSPASPLKNAKEIIDFQWEDRKELLVFNIVADGKLENYNAVKYDAPSRLVLDLWSVDTKYPKPAVTVKSALVQKMRIGRYPDKVRLVFDSTKAVMPPYQINRVNEKLVVSFGNAASLSESQQIIQEKGKLASAPKKPVKSGTLTRIDFNQVDHKSRITVGTTEEPQFESRMLSKDVLVVDIKNAFVPKSLQRPLDTSQFASAVNFIQIQNVKTGKTNDVRVSVTMREAVPYETSQEGKLLFIDIAAPKTVGATKDAAAKEEGKTETQPEQKSVAEVKQPAIEVPVAAVQPPPPAVEKAAPPAEITAPPVKEAASAAEEKKIVEPGLPEKVYIGRKISLDFKDADIKNILRLIAEVSNLNIITGDDVSGKITMRLMDVPWDQALDVVLQSRNLGKSKVGNVMRIAPLDTLKKEDQTELEAKRAKEKLEDLITELIPINYATGKEIMPQVKSVLSERGDVKVDERTNILIVKDIARNIASVKSLVKSLDTKTPQVLIEARIIEAGVTFQRELGVSWGFIFNTGNATFKGSTAPGGKVVDLPAIARSGAGTALGTAGALQGLITGAGSLELLDIAVSAHENKGDVRIISSPKIATLDNKEASIEQGLRIPYLKLTTEGTVTTDFIDANLKLTVTPHVTNEGTIKMNVKAKKDRPDNSITVQGVPSIDKKEAITEVLVEDNGVVVIAGIYTIEKTNGNEGIPLFNKIPVLGWLFKREATEDIRKDLLIFISPRIIKDQI
jgi:type IV pilus assembly protein PilQ